MKFPHTITRASAGTGKTFQLSSRYLGLVHHGEPPEKILATTFARKAAGEILDRILLRLAEAALDEQQRELLAESVEDTSLSFARCVELLRQMTGRLHRLRVGTIDSFFAQIARAFAFELGVPPGWQIAEETDDAAMRDEAIEAVLAAHDHQDLLRLVNLLTQGDAQRSVSQLIRATVDDLYQIYLEAEPEAWEALPRFKPLDEEQLALALEELRCLELAHKRLQTARDEDYARAIDGEWKKFLGTGLAGKLMDGEETYYNQPIVAEAQAVYQRLMQHAAAVLMSRAANFTLGARELLEHFDAAYRRLKHRRRLLRFEDITRVVGDVAQQDRGEALAFRLDAHIDHLLLDEFQDTSPAQWAAIRPFAERVVARSLDAAAASVEGAENSKDAQSLFDKHSTRGVGSSFYCVGDTKQAIYGWRGGVAEIFDSIARQLDVQGAERPLNKSYRSAQTVIDTVNRVFTHLTHHPEAGRGEPAIAAFEQSFPHHKTAKTKLTGYACLRTAPLDEDDQKACTYRYAAKYIAGLVEQTPDRSIGVLCRSNEALANLIYELRTLGIHASEEGGNPLTDSAAVNLILSLLKLADHPGDTIARHHLATSPLAGRLRIRDRKDTAAALRISRDIRRQLLEEGYGPAIYAWTRWLADECNAREWSRLTQLVEMAYAYGPSATLRTADFIGLVQTQRVADPTAHHVRVMTIHRAKGLEFDVVVLPELDVPFVGQSPPFITHRRDETGPIDCVFKYVPQDLQPLLPKRFEQMIEASTHRAVTETMCVLYVALTRAVHALHMIVPPSKSNERKVPSRLDALLRCALVDEKPTAPRTLLWEHGDRQWHQRPGAGAEAAETRAADEAAKASPLVVRLAPSDDGARRSLERIAPSRMHAVSGKSVEQLFAEAENTYAKDRGTLIHACFEQIEWLDEGPPDRQTLRRVVNALAPASLDTEALLDEFGAMLQRGQIQDVLCRRFYQRYQRQVKSKLTMQVRREHNFAMTGDEGQLIQGSIDRLVLLCDGEKLIAADVVDFKTDSDPTAAADRHGEQLLAYRDAVARLFHLPAESISARLLMVADGSVVNIAPGKDSP